jgi:hypothetical protein
MKIFLKRLPLLLFILVVLFSGYTAYHYAYHILDSDASSELVLGKLLADQSRIVTSDWFYSSEIRFFGTNLVYMPLFKLLSDWHLIRFISILVFQAMLAGSYYFLTRKANISRNAYFVSASLMLLPLNVVYGRIVLYHNYYIPCFVFGFLIAGLYLSFMGHTGQRRRVQQALRLTGLLLLTLMSSMNGFRQLYATIVPLFCTALFCALKEGRGSWKSPNETPNQIRMQIGLASAVVAVSAAGLYVHTHVLSKVFHFIEMDNTAVKLPTAQDLRNVAEGYLALFGFQGGRVLFSPEGILAFSGVLAAAILLIVSLGNLFRRKEPADFRGNFTVTMFPIAMLCMTAILLLLPFSYNAPQYYLPAFAWIFPYLGLAAGTFPASLRQLKPRQMLVILASLCLLANGIYNNLYYLQPDGKQVMYNAGIDIRAKDHLDGAIAFIEENDLEVGYATFWNANLLTEATNGRIPMIPVIRAYPDSAFRYDDILTDARCRELPFVEDKTVFLLLTLSEGDIFSNTDLAQYSIPAYEDAYYRIYVFDFSDEVWTYLLDQAVYYNQSSVLDQLLPAEN